MSQRLKISSSSQVSLSTALHTVWCWKKKLIISIWKDAMLAVLGLGRKPWKLLKHLVLKELRLLQIAISIIFKESSKWGLCMIQISDVILSSVSFQFVLKVLLVFSIEFHGLLPKRTLFVIVTNNFDISWNELLSKFLLTELSQIYFDI